MAYDEELANRIRVALEGTPAIVEKRMFGGVAFLMRRKMLVGVHKDALVVRISPAETEQALRDPNTRIFDITGRPMKGWIMVQHGGLSNAKLGKWISMARDFARKLPGKQARKRK